MNGGSLDARRRLQNGSADSGQSSSPDTGSSSSSGADGASLADSLDGPVRDMEENSKAAPATKADMALTKMTTPQATVNDEDAETIRNYQKASNKSLEQHQQVSTINNNNNELTTKTTTPKENDLLDANEQQQQQVVASPPVVVVPKQPLRSSLVASNNSSNNPDGEQEPLQPPQPEQKQKQAANNNYSGLNLNMTASEMRELIARRKKFDPKKAQMNIRQKYEIIQQM